MIGMVPLPLKVLLSGQVKPGACQRQGVGGKDRGEEGRGGGDSRVIGADLHNISSAYSCIPRPTLEQYELKSRSRSKGKFSA